MIPNDSVLLGLCKTQIEKHRSINVTHFLKLKGFDKDYPNENEFKSAVRRVRHLLLEDERYLESSEKGADGQLRIRFNPKYKRPTWREKNPFLNEIRLGLFTAFFSLIVGWLLLRADNQNKAQKDSLQDELIRVLSDSVKILQKHPKDTSLHD